MCKWNSVRVMRWRLVAKYANLQHILWDTGICSNWRHWRHWSKILDSWNNIPAVVWMQIVCTLSRLLVFNSATPYAIACQTPLSMGLSRQEYWSGLPFSSLGDLPDPGSNPHLLHCRRILCCWASWEALREVLWAPNSRSFTGTTCPVFEHLCAHCCGYSGLHE